MITGFNHNVKYRDRVFHVQTEDNGEKTPLIFTHLFDGGDILATRKIDYHAIVGKPDFEKQVRRMMEDQHKAMLKALMRGDLDGIIDGHDNAAKAAIEAMSRPGAAASPAPSSETFQAPEPVPLEISVPAPPPVAVAAAPAPPPPAHAAHASKAPRRGVTLFGESIVSEKTLDEVILNYLIDQGTEKK